MSNEEMKMSMSKLAGCWVVAFLDGSGRRPSHGLGSEK